MQHNAGHKPWAAKKQIQECWHEAIHKERWIEASGFLLSVIFLVVGYDVSFYKVHEQNKSANESEKSIYGKHLRKNGIEKIGIILYNGKRRKCLK